MRLQVDLRDRAATEALLEAGGQLGWDVTLGPSQELPPHLQVTGPDELRRRDPLSGGDPEPQILLFADPDTLRPEQLLGIRVFGFLKPDMDSAAVRRCLLSAAQGQEERQSAWERRREVEDRVGEASLIMKLALELTPGMKIDEVLGRIVDGIYEDLGYRIVSIMLLDEERRFLHIRSARGLSPGIVASSRMETGKGVSGSVAQSGRPLLVSDVEADPRFGKGRSHGRYSGKSLICVPLKVGDRVIGVLNANNKLRRKHLNEHDLRVLTVFAAHVSNHIERARLLEDLEAQAEQLREAYGKLQAIDRVKTDFIINVSHEYRTPVTIILGYLELLRNSLEDPSQLGKVATAMEAANRLSNLIDDSTELLRLDTGTISLQYRLVSPHHFLQELVQRMWSRFGNKGVDLGLNLPEDLPMVRIDVDRMTRAFERILDNALKFTPAGGFTRLEAERCSGGGIRIFVEDSGPGIGQQDKARIFERFEQGGNIMTEKPEGTGLGLPIARSIITQHGGTIAADEARKTGCRIIVTLPEPDDLSGN